jgi:hypothetical protein
MTTLNNGLLEVSFDDAGGVIDSLIDLSTSIDFFGPRGSSMEPHAILVSTWGDPSGADFGGWPLNMTQGNDQTYGSPAPIIVGPALIDGEWYYKTQLIVFPYSDEPGDVGNWTVEQWVSLVGKALKVRSKVTYSGPDKSGGWGDWTGENASGIGLNMWNQETPTRYLRDGNGLNRIYYYCGTAPWTNAAVTGPVINVGGNALAYAGALQPTEQWVHFARLSDGYGLAMYCPDVDYIAVAEIFNDNDQPYGAGGIAHGFCNDVGPLKGPTLEFTTYWTAGTVAEVRATIYDIHSGVDSLTSSSAIENVELILTHGEFSIEASNSIATLDTPSIIRQGGEFIIEDCLTASTIETVVLAQSYGVLAVSDCVAASTIAALTITLNSNGSGIRSPSGISHTPRSITGEQLTIRRYSNGAWI